MSAKLPTTVIASHSNPLPFVVRATLHSTPRQSSNRGASWCDVSGASSRTAAACCGGALASATETVDDAKFLKAKWALIALIAKQNE